MAARRVGLAGRLSVLAIFLALSVALVAPGAQALRSQAWDDMSDEFDGASRSLLAVKKSRKGSGAKSTGSKYKGDNKGSSPSYSGYKGDSSPSYKGDSSPSYKGDSSPSYKGDSSPSYKGDGGYKGPTGIGESYGKGDYSYSSPKGDGYSPKGDGSPKGYSPGDGSPKGYSPGDYSPSSPKGDASPPKYSPDYEKKSPGYSYSPNKKSPGHSYSPPKESPSPPKESPSPNVVPPPSPGTPPGPTPNPPGPTPPPPQPGPGPSSVPPPVFPSPPAFPGASPSPNFSPPNSPGASPSPGFSPPNSPGGQISPQLSPSPPPPVCKGPNPPEWCICNELTIDLLPAWCFCVPSENNILPPWCDCVDRPGSTKPAECLCTGAAATSPECTCTPPFPGAPLPEYCKCLPRPGYTPPKECDCVPVVGQTVPEKCKCTARPGYTPPKDCEQEGQMWGDPMFRGFDGSRFEYHGKPKTWYTLLKAGSDLDMTTMFIKVPNTRPGTTVASQVRLVHGKDVVRVVMVRLPGNRKRLDVYIGNSAAIKVTKVPFRKEMPGGTVVKCGYHLSPPAYCILETESVDTLVTLNSNNSRPTNGLNVIVTIKSALPGPVEGLLGRTYKNAARASRASRSAAMEF